MGNNSAKTFYQKQYDLSSLDPHIVLNVPNDFTWEQLKTSYRNAALQTHPDKPNGNKEVFEFVTSCFEKLALEYKSKESNKTHYELKKQSSDYFNKIVNTNMEHPSVVFENSEPFHKRFNKAFDECKYVEENVQFGYGDNMIKSSGYREDIKIENIFSKNNVNTKQFNEVFNKTVPLSKSIIKYKEPEPLLMAKKLQFTEIDGKRPDDYSGKTENKNLSYTDYMKAFNGERLANPEDIHNKKQFKNIKEYQKYREKKTKYDLTDKEKRQIEKKKILEEQQERERLERIQNNDNAIYMAHQKANQLFIK